MDTKKQQTATPGPQNKWRSCPFSGSTQRRDNAKNFFLREGISKSSLRYYGNALTFARLAQTLHVATNDVRNLSKVYLSCQRRNKLCGF